MKKKTSLKALIQKAIAGACLFLSSCTVGPDYHRPKHCLPPQWHNAPVESENLDTSSLAFWWRLFNDPELDSLICRALKSNYDIKTATAKIREARALYRIEAANLWPNISFQALYEHQRFSKNALGTAQSVNSNAPNVGLSSFLLRTQDLFQASFDATWEIDLWGGILRGVESQYAQYRAVVENRRGVIISMLAEIARNYMELRGYQQQILVAEKNAKIQRETLYITQQRFHAGLATDLDIARAKGLLATTEATIPPLQTSVKWSIHRLSVLLGQEPGALYCELEQTANLPCNPPTVPVGMPAQLLCRRPDIREAERKLASASAQIGVAIAQLYPQISLSGNIGYQSSGLGNFVSPGSSFYSFGPILNLPIFNAGSLTAQVRANKALFEEALFQYRQIVLQALEDVENSLVAYAREHEHYLLLEESYVSYHHAVGLVREQYLKGLVDFLNVLSAEQDLFTAENAMLVSRIALSTDLVAIYKALGGGWECEEIIIPLP